ncbi:MAG: hypothetical protein HY549_03340 [Elusimicrobia bacterium]|nr:hypothetical protein [Elusimicrobiota bacterium]
MRSFRLRAEIGAWAVFAALALFHLYWVAHTAVDLPYWDDWEMLEAWALPGGLSWKWLFSIHSESVLVPTRLETWILYRLTAWNIAAHQILNFLVFLLGPLLAAAAARASSAGLPGPLAPAFLIFWLSPLAFENHSWATNGCIHFQISFLLAAAYFWFRHESSWPLFAAGLGMTWLSLNSFSSGIPASLALVLGFCAFKMKSAMESKSAGRARTLRLQAALAAMFVGCALLWWKSGYRKIEGSPSLTWPDTAEFWRFFLNLIAQGFGMDQLSAALGMLCLILALAPLKKLLSNRQAMPQAWAAATLIGAALAIMAAIALGRASQGLGEAKTSRYAEFGMLLPFLTAWAWQLRLAKDGRRVIVIACLWAFCFLGFLNNWRFDVYRTVEAKRLEGRRCIEKNLGSAPLICRGVYPFDLSAKLDRARALELSFTRPWAVLNPRAGI